MTTEPMPKTVLMVDDNPGDLGLVRQVLDTIDEVALHAVSNVPQAHAFLMKRFPYQDAPDPDLILLDLRMPMVSGHAVITAVKQNPKLSHTKVVVFTSSQLDADRLQCETLGADDYVCKPTDWSAWQTTIGLVLKRHRLVAG